jgi:CheY-like chemotaxis protein
MNLALSIDPSTPPRVLVADANDDTRQLYRERIFAGCDVVEASDGRDALAKAFVRVPSLVVTDMMLPFLDGVALCEILRRDTLTRAVPIMVVTSDSRPEQLMRVRRAGADVVMVKPTDIDQIREGARRLLEQSTELCGRASAARANAAQQAERSRQLLAAVDTGAHRARSKALARFETTTPPQAPPKLVCPSCDAPLIYQHSHVGGVSDRHPEQWDYYACSATCGTFQYRQRTRKLRRVS